MKDQKPLAERILDALKQDGPMTLEEIAEHAETTVGTLNTMMGTLKKQHGVVKIQPNPRQPAKYQIGGAPKPSVSKPVPSAPKRGSAIRAALVELVARRATLRGEVEKLDRAIEVIEALAA